MKKINIEEGFDIIELDKGEKVDLRGYNNVRQLQPYELHIMQDGDQDDKPSFAFVLRDGYGSDYVAQISNRMLTEGLERVKAL